MSTVLIITVVHGDWGSICQVDAGVVSFALKQEGEYPPVTSSKTFFTLVFISPIKFLHLHVFQWSLCVVLHR